MDRNERVKAIFAAKDAVPWAIAGTLFLAVVGDVMTPKLANFFLVVIVLAIGWGVYFNHNLEDDTVRARLFWTALVTAGPALFCYFALWSPMDVPKVAPADGKLILQNRSLADEVARVKQERDAALQRSNNQGQRQVKINQMSEWLERLGRIQVSLRRNNPVTKDEFELLQKEFAIFSSFSLTKAQFVMLDSDSGIPTPIGIGASRLWSAENQARQLLINRWMYRLKQYIDELESQ